VRILVTFALENEFAPWRSMRKFRKAKWDSADVLHAEIGAADVYVLLTGVGSRQAALAMAKVGWGEPDTVEFCISAGMAGALRPQYQIGQVLAPRTVVAERAPAGSNGLVFETSAPLISFAEDCGATVVQRFYSAERVISRAEEKEYLGSTADAVEMESFTVLSHARANGVPGAAIRAVSDTVEEDLPLDMNGVFTSSGTVSIPRVLGQVALHPQSIPGLVKLGHNSKLAAEALAAFLDRYIRDLSRRTKALESNAMATGS
jgi:nucleoside phosphorylase